MSNKSVTVVGAGAWGSWTAYFLQLGGYSVTLVDRWGAGNSNSGSGGETRIIRTVYGGDELYTQMAHRSLELWHKYLPFWNAELYHETGSLWLSREENDYVTGSKIPMEKLGYPLDRLEVEEAKQRYPHVNFKGINAVYFEPTCGYLEARNACRKVAEEFQKLGGTYLNDKVEKVNASNEIDSLTSSNGNTLKSDFYIFACGPWIGKLFPELKQHIYISRQEVYFFQDELLRQGTQLPMWLEFRDDGDMYFGVPDHFNRGFKISFDSRDISFDPEHEDRTITPHLLDKMRAYIGLRFPSLEGAKLVESRVCPYENSLDGDYIMDYIPNAQNGIVLGGTSGHGFKMAPAIGEMVLNFIHEGTALPERFGLDRFQSIKSKRTQFD